MFGLKEKTEKRSLFGASKSTEKVLGIAAEENLKLHEAAQGSGVAIACKLLSKFIETPIVMSPYLKQILGAEPFNQITILAEDFIQVAAAINATVIAEASEAESNLSAINKYPGIKLVICDTSLKPKLVNKLIALGVKDLATATIADHGDMIKKFNSYQCVQILTPEPGDWGYAPQNTIQLAKLAIATKLWPIIEVREGKLANKKEPSTIRPEQDFYSAQSKFKL